MGGKRMGTYDEAKQSSQYTNTRSIKSNIWPPSGSSASDILKTNLYVMVAADLFATTGFQMFYQEWILNVDLGKEKQIYVPSVEFEDTSIPSIYRGMQLLQYKECDNYVSLFRYVKSMGTWLFLTGNERKMESIIKASKETGAYVRVYGLDNDGKLKNYRLPKKNQPHESKTTISHTNIFSLPNQISPFKKVVRKTQSVPGRGDIVYTSNHQFVRLGEEFFSNPQSITYQTDKQGVQAKIYQGPWLTISYFEDKAKRMLEEPMHCEGICWPIDLLYNSEGEFIGILVPAAEGYQLKQQLMSQQGLEKNFPNWNRCDLTHLTKVILDKIVYLQDRNILFGLVNPSAIFVKDENHVYFAEMDTYQIEGYPILSYERVMQAPELQDASEGMRLYTKQQDNYEIALLVFMLLMPGKFPYNKGNNKSISESIKNMNFAFRYGKQGEEHGAREYFGLWRFAWSHLGNDLRQAFYYTFQYNQVFSMPEKRRDARFWQKKVAELERELNNPYDKESLKIFPRTFKRFSGTKTIQCIKCGIDHPVFYYRYPEKRVCNSCLGQPSQTHFICKSCEKSFYYDFGTLFKYEKLVETKDFSMPTHCPYCRSDKRKCVSCGKLVPAYRINEKGMCFDCAKLAREQVARRYYCKCGREIVLTQGEVDFYMKKFGRLPQRCKQCRDSHRNGY